MDQLPDDHNRPGGLPRDLACGCGHAHHWLVCECGCPGLPTPGID